jgi:AcrR family transcriptional regulator
MALEALFLGLVNTVHFINDDRRPALPTPLDLDASPAERRRQKVRGAILEAADRVFSNEGEAGLSIRRLAEEIDYSPAAIYKYFGSKDELVEELKEAFFARLMQSIDPADLQVMSFDHRVRRCFRTYIEVAAERPHHYVAAFSSPGTPGTGDCPFQDTKKGQAFMTVAALVQEGQQAGVFDPALDPVLAAKSLWASMHGLALLLIHLPGFPSMIPGNAAPISDEQFTAYHVDLMVRSLQSGNASLKPVPAASEKTDV